MKDVHIDMTGNQYGQWTALHRIEGVLKVPLYLCRCSCGEEKIRKGYTLRQGKSTKCKSCSGKYRSKKPITQNKFIRNVWHRIVHSTTDESHQDYGYYGGRGIKIYSGWVDDFYEFQNWALENGWEKGLEIDRIDNDGDYEPSNCRFVTRKENIMNRRCTIKLTINGETDTLLNFCERYNVNYSTAHSRLKKGWSHEECIFGRRV